MRFNPSTEDEVQARAVWGRGLYAFRVVDAEERISEAGNEMIDLKIELHKRDGATKIVHDYLLAKGPAAAKFLHACVVCGVLDKWKAGVVSADDFVGKSGRLKLSIQTRKQWPTKNVVTDYV